MKKGSNNILFVCLLVGINAWDNLRITSENENYINGTYYYQDYYNSYPHYINYAHDSNVYLYYNTSYHTWIFGDSLPSSNVYEYCVCFSSYVEDCTSSCYSTNGNNLISDYTIQISTCESSSFSKFNSDLGAIVFIIICVVVVCVIICCVRRIRKNRVQQPNSFPIQQPFYNIPTPQQMNVISINTLPNQNIQQPLGQYSEISNQTIQIEEEGEGQPTQYMPQSFHDSQFIAISAPISQIVPTDEEQVSFINKYQPGSQQQHT